MDSQDDNMEPDGMPPDDDTPPVPPRKPSPPKSQDMTTKTGMANALNDAANSLRAGGNTLKASDLSVDHPYGDGKYAEMSGDTLKRLGAGQAYGGGDQ